MAITDKNKTNSLYYGPGKTGLLRSGFGSQAISEMQNAPKYGFGQSPRDSTQKMFLSLQHDKAVCQSSGGNNSNGPIYAPISSIGKQWISNKTTSPMPRFGKSLRSQMAKQGDVPGPGMYENRNQMSLLKNENYGVLKSHSKFGTASRDMSQKVYISQDHEKVFYGNESPGPGCYFPRDIFGKQLKSRCQSAPSWKLGTEKRFNYPYLKRAAQIPGAGSYDTNQTYSNTVLSKSSSAPCFKFSRALNSGQQKIYISKEHEKDLLGLAPPGPTTAKIIDGKDPCKKNLGNCVFGKAKRETKYANAVPGPGAYAA